METYFERSDNLIDKNLRKKLQEKSFTDKRNVISVIKELKKSFAERLLNGDIQKAKEKLMNT